MVGLRALGVGALALVLATHVLHGQSGSHYREFQLGGNLASVSSLTGVAVSEATVVHQRPAIMQDLQWRRPYAWSGSVAAPVDSVQQVVFSFYNDQLFRLVVDYDRSRTEGMTDVDMIEAISSVYGVKSKLLLPPSRVGVPEVEQESGTRLARWGDEEFTAVLYRSSSASGFRMIVTSVPLGALARTAAAQALRLDEREAPQLEIARQKKADDETRTALEKSRATNKAVFQP